MYLFIYVQTKLESVFLYFFVKKCHRSKWSVRKNAYNVLLQYTGSHGRSHRHGQWSYGLMITWSHDHMITWSHGYNLHDHMVTWSHGHTWSLDSKKSIFHSSVECGVRRGRITFKFQPSPSSLSIPPSPACCPGSLQCTPSLFSAAQHAPPPPFPLQPNL